MARVRLQVQAGRRHATAAVELSASATPRLADVVCGVGNVVGQSVVLAVPATVAGKFARGDRVARNESVSQKAATLCAGLALRLSLLNSGGEKGDRRMVGAAAGGNLLSVGRSRLVSFVDA